jgi:hypothetical protein
MCGQQVLLKCGDGDSAIALERKERRGNAVDFAMLTLTMEW